MPIRDLHAYWPQFLPDGRHFLLPAQREGRAPGHLRDGARLLAEHAGPRNGAGPSTPRDTCCSCATASSSLRRSMTVRCGRAANRFVLRMASATGPPRLRIRPSPRRAPAFWLTARVWCSDQPSLARSRRSDHWPAHRTACVRIAAPVARSNERHGGHHRCDDRAARSLAAGAGPWHNLTRDVRPIERLVSRVVA